MVTLLFIELEYIILIGAQCKVQSINLSSNYIRYGFLSDLLCLGSRLVLSYAEPYNVD